VDRLGLDDVCVAVDLEPIAAAWAWRLGYAEIGERHGRPTPGEWDGAPGFACASSVAAAAPACRPVRYAE